MLDIAASISNLIGAVDTAPMKSPAPSGSNGFLSLLNIGLDKTGNDSSPASGDQNASRRSDDRNDNQDTPVATAADIAAPIQNAPPPSAPEHLAVAPRDESRAKTPVPSGNDNQAPVASSDQTISDNQNQAPAQMPAASSEADSVPAAGAPLVVKTASTGKDDATSDTTDSQTVSGDLQAQLGAISAILQSMIQVLSNPAVPQQASVTPSGTPAANPAGAATVSDPAQSAPSGAVPLLKDIASLLAQMQQTLQGNAADTTQAVSTAPQTQAASSSPDTSNLQALTDLLQKDVNQLSQLLAPQPLTTASQANVPMTPVVPAAAPVLAQDTPVLADIGSQLKTSIAQVRAQLQKIGSANETIFAQAKGQFQASQSDIGQMFKDALGASGMTVKDIVKDVANVPAPVVVAPQTPVITVSDTQANAIVVATAFAVNVAQGSSDSGSDTSSGGNGQGQQALAQPVTGMAQAQTTNAAAGSAFAKTLGEVSQGSVLQQVTFQVKTAVADGSSKITIQLHPVELGKLDIKIDVGADGKAGVTVTADNKETLAMLQQDSQGLTRALHEAGLSMDSGSLSFNLRGGQQDQGQGGNQQAATNYRKSQPEEENDAALNVINRSYTVNLAEGLNIQI